MKNNTTMELALDGIPEVYEVEDSAPSVCAPRFWTGAELDAAQFAPLAYAVHGLLPEGQITFSGKSKGGKSWVCYQLACAVTGGREIWDGFPSTQGDVLLLALEDSPRRSQFRLRTVMAGTPIPRELTIVTNETGFPPLHAGGYEFIGNWLAEHTLARLVIIDTLQKIVPPKGRNEDDYSHSYGIMSRLQKMALDHHVTIVCVRHTNKGVSEDPAEASTGSNGWTAAADAIITMEGRRGAPSAKLHVIGRDFASETYAIERTDTGIWSLAGTVQEKEGRGDQAAQWLSLLLSAGEKRASEVFTLARDQGFSDNAVKEAKLILSVQSRKQGFSEGWLWRLPQTTTNPVKDDWNSSISSDSFADFLGNSQESAGLLGESLDLSRRDAKESESLCTNPQQNAEEIRRSPKESDISPEAVDALF